MVIFWKKGQIYDFNVFLSNPQDHKLIYEFGTEMKFDIKQKDEKVTVINHL